MGLNPAEGMDVCLLCSLCDVQVAASVMVWVHVQRNHIRCVCLIACDLENSKWGGLGLMWTVAPQEQVHTSQQCSPDTIEQYTYLQLILCITALVFLTCSISPWPWSDRDNSVRQQHYPSKYITYGLLLMTQKCDFSAFFFLGGGMQMYSDPCFCTFPNILDCVWENMTSFCAFVFIHKYVLKLTAFRLLILTYYFSHMYLKPLHLLNFTLWTLTEV